MNSAKHEPIAVVGYSCILPGGENVVESWDMIEKGIDALSDLPPDRVDVTAYYDPDQTTKDKIYCTRGGFIPEFDFDPREYGLNVLQMEDCDTNQTLSLLKVKQALQHANVPLGDGQKKNMGCVLGIGGGAKASHEFYSRLNYVVVDRILRKAGMAEKDVEKVVEKYKGNFPEWRLDSFPGFLGNVVAGRICNVFDLDGMNCVVDAACASSLAALKMSIDELITGDCESMICGATCTDNSLGMYMAFSKTPVFSRAQKCNAYDENTGGMLIGEGSVMLVLKRLSVAQRDGDKVHALIRSCASASDGKAPGIYAPTISGQMTAIQRAYDRAGVEASSVSMIEGHGTGTPKGDKIELSALTRVFERAGTPRQSVAVGSVKTQIGHLKACAGMAGVLKAILAVKHKTLPSSINCVNPPCIYSDEDAKVSDRKLTETPLYINVRRRPWFTEDPTVPRRAGVSSFGFGGANYHAVIEEAESEHAAPYRESRTCKAVVVSAANISELASKCSDLLQRLGTDESTGSRKRRAVFENVCGLHAAGAEVIPDTSPRLGFVCSDPDEMCDKLRTCASHISGAASGASSRALRMADIHFADRGRSGGKVAALFSGQGSQYVHMFDEVAMHWPPMRECISTMDQVGTRVCGRTVSSHMYPRGSYAAEAETKDKEDAQSLAATLMAQPATVSSSLGIYDIFSKAGFRPDVFAGHSLGELSALCAAGMLEYQDLCELVWRRAEIMGKHCGGTEGMAAVLGDNASTVRLTEPNVYVANLNSPKQVVITGDKEAVKRQGVALEKQGFKVVQLNVEGAFHCRYMSAATREFASHVASAPLRPSPRGRVYSNVSAATYPQDIAGCKDLLSKHMESAVRFEEQINAMYDAGARTFVEFGPRATLTKVAQQILAGRSAGDTLTFVAVNPSHAENSDMAMRRAAVELCVAGVPMGPLDPWAVPDPSLDGAEVPSSRTTLRLSASTYVSKSTRKKRDALLEDGFQIGGRQPTGNDGDFASLQAKLKDTERELESMRQEVKRHKEGISKATAIMNNCL